MGNFLYGFIQVIKQPFKLIYPTEIIGKEKVENKKLILVFNHLSGWDPVVWSIWSKTRTRFMYKSSFDKSAFLRAVFKSLEFVSVRRGEADVGAVKESMQILQENKVFGLFPEGTRNKEVDCLQPFKVGAAMLAIKTKSPIRPVYIFDRMKKFHKNYMLVGDEFTLEQFYDMRLTRNVLEEATAIIRQKMDDARIELNKILEERQVKRRKRTKKELKERDAFIKARTIREKKRAEHIQHVQEMLEINEQTSETDETQQQSVTDTDNAVANKDSQE